MIYVVWLVNLLSQVFNELYTSGISSRGQCYNHSVILTSFLNDDFLRNQYYVQKLLYIYIMYEPNSLMVCHFFKSKNNNSDHHIDSPFKLEDRNFEN
jgi:hypothetical protein